jgi:hypothetical protein
MPVSPAAASAPHGGTAPVELETTGTSVIGSGLSRGVDDSNFVAGVSDADDATAPPLMPVTGACFDCDCSDCGGSSEYLVVTTGTRTVTAREGVGACPTRCGTSWETGRITTGRASSRGAGAA